MRFKGVIFDLDGTLLDTLEDLADAANGMLAEHRFPTHPTEDYRYFVGDGVQMLVTRALPENARDPKTIEACMQTMRVHYQRHLNVKTKPYEGILDLLDQLSGRGVKMAVLTNKPTAFAQPCVDGYFRVGLFDSVIGQQDGLPRKPDPTGAIQIARGWTFDPADILYVGDTSTDMETAVGAGMMPVGALWGFRPRKELEQHGAKVVIDHPTDLLRLLESDLESRPRQL